MSAPNRFDYTIVPASETDREMLRLAYRVASRSSDPNTKNGSVLVPVRDQEYGIITGFNGLPGPIADRCPDYMLTPALKYPRIKHAENGVIFAAAREGFPTRNSTIYVPWYACSVCAVAVVEAGITRVVGHRSIMDRTPDRWAAEVELGLSILREGEVRCDVIDEVLGMTARFDGENIDV